MPSFPRLTALLMPLSVFALASLASGVSAQDADKQDADKKPGCVGILCQFTGEAGGSGSSGSGAADEITMPKTGLIGALMSGRDGAKPVAPADAPVAPPADAAAAAAQADPTATEPPPLPDAKPRKDAEYIDARPETADRQEKVGCVASARDPWQCDR